MSAVHYSTVVSVPAGTYETLREECERQMREKLLKVSGHRPVLKWEKRTLYSPEVGKFVEVMILKGQVMIDDE